MQSKQGQHVSYANTYDANSGLVDSATASSGNTALQENKYAFDGPGTLRQRLPKLPDTIVAKYSETIEYDEQQYRCVALSQPTRNKQITVLCRQYTSDLR